jgi:hypothetical protein
VLHSTDSASVAVPQILQRTGSRAVASTLSPAASAASTMVRPTPRKLPVMSQTLGMLPFDLCYEPAPPNDRAALEIAVIATWSLVHGLTMLYIDGLATLETAKTIDDLAEKVVAILMYGLLKREK